MIQEINIKNYMSFRDEVTFSFEAVKEDTFDILRQTVEVSKDVRLLRFAVLFGANASGKSNFLKALETFDSLFDLYQYSQKKIPRFEFDDFSKNEPIYFSTIVWVEDWTNKNKFYKCEYSIEFSDEEILEEKFLLDDQVFFSRKNEDGFSKIELSDSTQFGEKEKGYIEFSCNKYTTLISIIRNANLPNKDNFAINLIIRFCLCFRCVKAPQISSSLPDHLEYNKYVLNIFKNINFEINNINNPSHKNYKFGHVTIENGKEKTYELSPDQESIGTISFINILNEFKKSSNFNYHSLICFDEPDNSLHFLWFKYFIELFFDSLENQYQMIITTHNAELLDCVNRWLRADSIWFVNKNNENLVSELYSLVDFNGLEDIKYISKAYLNGYFGALPILDDKAPISNTDKN